LYKGAFDNCQDGSSFGNALEPSSFGNGAVLGSSVGPCTKLGDLVLCQKIPNDRKAMKMTPSGTERPMATFAAVDRPDFGAALPFFDVDMLFATPVGAETEFNGDAARENVVVSPVPRYGAS
jgi:hypothetical protein